MILTGPAIRDAVRDGRITIEPYEETNVNPASIDLRLSRKVLVYEHPTLDAQRSHSYRVFDIPITGLQLLPGTLYLMATQEVLRTYEFVTVIDGKSSIGRLGISIHQTAGYGDPGYWGQYTLEVSCMMPVTIYAGMKFCQARFHTVMGQIENYENVGNYVCREAPVIGPKASRAYRQWKQ